MRNVAPSRDQHRLKIEHARDEGDNRIHFVCRKCGACVSISRNMLKILLIEKGTYLRCKLLGRCRG